MSVVGIDALIPKTSAVDGAGRLKLAPIVAIFDPVNEEPANPCHFIIVPSDDPIDDLLVWLGEFMADDFPSGPKQPRRQEDITLAEEARERYNRVFEIVREARGT